MGFATFGKYLSFRLANALIIRTFFQPDEYFQCLEPAWKVAFGESSGAWITWEWHERLRSSLHPLFFAAVYRAASTISTICGLSASKRASILIMAPKIVQAVIAATTDYFTGRLAGKIYGANSAAAIAVSTLTVMSPWNAFASVRTLSNSLETTFTVIALSYWPWDWYAVSNNVAVSRELYVSTAAAALACILRPTNILIWLILSLTFLATEAPFRKAQFLSRGVIASGLAVLAVSVGMDYGFYGELVFPQLRFLHYNLVQRLAAFYGTNRMDYYVSEGLPLLLTTAIPATAYGIWKIMSPPRAPQTAMIETRQHIVLFPLALAAWMTIVAFSLIPHKEVRFIYPLLPILLVVAAKPQGALLEYLLRNKPLAYKMFIALNSLVSFGIMYYTCLVHQRGVVDVMHYLRHQYDKQLDQVPTVGTWARPQPEMTVGFLMPCHSTPWRSHLVYPEINAWALTCEPPLNLTMEERETYLDEADKFYAGPESWINQNMKDRDTVMNDTGVAHINVTNGEGKRDWPQYLAFFEQIESTMKSVLDGTNYKECKRFFNTHWHDDWRRQGDVVVWCTHWKHHSQYRP